jgi:Na+/melibiose symporter-like transporter
LTTVDRRLSWWRLAAFSSPSFIVGALGIPLGVYLPAYYAGELGLDLGAVGIAFALVQIIAIGFDPGVGLGIDATLTRQGRFRPWMLGAAPVLMVATFAVFMAGHGVSFAYTVLWQLLLYVGLSMTMMSTNAWGAVLAPEYHERSRLFAWVQMISFGGALACLLLPVILGFFGEATPGSVVHAMGWLVIVVAPAAAIAAAFLVGEPQRATAPRERIGIGEYLALIRHPAMLRMLPANLLLAAAPALTGALYFFFFVEARDYSFEQATMLLLIYIAAGLVMPLWARIARVTGKHRALMIAAGVNALGQCTLLVLPHHLFWPMAAIMFVVGFAANSYGLLFNAMVADVADELRLETGKDRTAPLYALMIVAAKIGAAVPLAVTFPILKAIGFNPKQGAVNTVAAIHGLENCFVLAPVLAIAVGGLCLVGYHLNAARHDAIRKELDGLDALASGLASDGALNAATHTVPLVESAE